MKILLREGAMPYNFKLRRYTPRKQAFLVATCSALESEKLFGKVRFGDWISAPLLVPKKPPAHSRVTIDLRQSNFSRNKDEQPMLNIEQNLIQAACSIFFGEADIVHRSFQILFDPDDAHIHSLWVAGAHSLYELTRGLQGFDLSRIHLHVHTAEFSDKIRESICFGSTFGYAQQVFSRETHGPDPILWLLTENTVCAQPHQTLSIHKTSNTVRPPNFSEGIKMEPKALSCHLEMGKPTKALEIHQFYRTIN